MAVGEYALSRLEEARSGERVRVVHARTTPARV
jgi:hypothetical protein